VSARECVIGAVSLFVLLFIVGVIDDAHAPYWNGCAAGIVAGVLTTVLCLRPASTDKEAQT
jgi:hypothetical protein